MSGADARLRALEDEVATLREIVEVYEETVSQQSARMEQLVRDLRRSNADLDQFAYAASHDLRTPLRSIASLATYVVEDMGDALTPEARGHLDKIAVRIARMENLIQGMLEFSRVSRVRPRPGTVDVGDLLRQIADMVDPPAGIRIVAEGPFPTIVAEKPRLQQVLINLVANAVKYHDKPSGTVRVTCEDAGAQLRFSVADDGPGIAPEFHERVFGMFQRLEASDKVEGTGIGLALVRRIVEDQGGTVTLESKLGHGSTFRFTWPREPVARGVQVVDGARPLPPPPREPIPKGSG